MLYIELDTFFVKYYLVLIDLYFMKFNASKVCAKY